MKKGIVFKPMRSLADRLESECIPYAVIGGMALAAHGYVRMTLGVDILLSPYGLALFREKLLGRGYNLDFPGAEKSFRDTETNVKIEVITAGEFPGDGLPKPVVFPDFLQTFGDRLENGIDGSGCLFLRQTIQFFSDPFYQFFFIHYKTP